MRIAIILVLSVFLTSCATKSPKMWLIGQSEQGGILAYSDYHLIADETERNNRWQKDIESKIQCPESFKLNTWERKTEYFQSTCYIPTVDTYTANTNATVYSGLRSYSGTAKSTITKYGTQAYGCADSISWVEQSYTCNWNEVNKIRWSKFSAEEKIRYLIPKCGKRGKDFISCAYLAQAYLEVKQKYNAVGVMEDICLFSAQDYPEEEYSWAVGIASNSCFQAANYHVYEKNDSRKAVELYERGCDLKKETENQDSLYSCSFLAAYKKDKKLLKENIQGPLALCNESETVGCYDIACIYSIMGSVDESIGYLRKSLEGGYNDWEHINTDPDLATIRKTLKFRKMIEGYRRTVDLKESQSTNPLTPGLPSKKEDRTPASKR